jgi:hypothetical protein
MDTIMKPVYRFPARRYFGTQMQTTLLHMEMSRHRMNEKLDAEGYAGRRVLGYKLTEWQRQPKWDVDQCIKFIESIWLGVGLGHFMVNSHFENDAIDGILLDGQQRLFAIERYWNGEFTIQGDDGKAYHWTDLTEDEHRHFFRIPFPWIESQYKTEQECVDAYNRHNFSGTPHEAHEFAEVGKSTLQP